MIPTDFPCRSLAVILVPFYIEVQDFVLEVNVRKKLYEELNLGSILNVCLTRWPVCPFTRRSQLVHSSARGFLSPVCGMLKTGQGETLHGVCGSWESAFHTFFGFLSHLSSYTHDTFSRGCGNVSKVEQTKWQIWFTSCFQGAARCCSVCDVSILRI